MNWAIVLGVLRTVAPAILAFIAGRWPQYAGFTTELIALLGTAGAATWSGIGHTNAATISAAAEIPGPAKAAVFSGISDVAKLKAAATVPDVEKIITSRSAPPAIAQIALDSSQPKVEMSKAV